MDLDTILEYVTVLPLDSIDDREKREWSLNGWYAVIDTGGVIALFAHEEDALRFRLNYINSYLNPVTLSDDK